MNIKEPSLIVTLSLGILIVPLLTDAQQKATMYRIGFIGNSTAALEANLIGPFRDGLRDLGYLEG
jgi:putative tryptophan/tyrosine transport system substrate-binding protein